MHASGKTALEAKLQGSRVVLTCRRGAADDITYYTIRDGEKEYTSLEADGEHIVDDRPKLDPARPETRRYFAMLLYGGEETRMKTNEVVLTVP